MKIKVGDPKAHLARIFLNGVEQNKVLEADEEGRFIVRIATREDGSVVMNAARNNDYVRETLHGDVAIEFKDE